MLAARTCIYIYFCTDPKEFTSPNRKKQLDKLEGPKYAASRAELRRKAGEAASARDRQAAAAARTRQTRATRQRRKRQEGERREWDDREVA